jgi:hypothetical protein
MTDLTRRGFLGLFPVVAAGLVVAGVPAKLLGETSRPAKPEEVPKDATNEPMVYVNGLLMEPGGRDYTVDKRTGNIVFSERLRPGDSITAVYYKEGTITNRQWAMG